MMLTKSSSVNRTFNPEQGTTLIEVLVAIVIISIGLLSVAALQTVSLKSNNGSYLRSQATFLAYDLADRMRAAPDATRNDAYADGQGGDRQQWDQQVATLLGAGSGGFVTRNGDQITIAIQWNDNRARIRAENDVDDATLTTFNYQLEL